MTSRLKRKLFKPFFDLQGQLLQLQHELDALRLQTEQIAQRLDSIHSNTQSLYSHNWTSDKNLVFPDLGGLSIRIVALLRQLLPFDVKDRGFHRFGRELDGGYVMIDDLSMARAAISCGIATEVSWDREMAERGLIVHQFDHTVEASPEQHQNFRFRKLAIRSAAATGEITIPGIVAELGPDASGSILKIDIEGSEWDVFAAIEPQVLTHFSQIVVEFHDLHYLPQFIDKAEQAVRNLCTDFFVVHVHANNHEACYSIGGVIVPRVIEITFANRRVFESAPCTRNFPTEWDRQNNPHRPDIYLGKFNY